MRNQSSGTTYRSVIDIMTLPNVTASDYNDDYDYGGENNQSYACSFGSIALLVCSVF